MKKPLPVSLTRLLNDATIIPEPVVTYRLNIPTGCDMPACDEIERANARFREWKKAHPDFDESVPF